MKAKTALTPLEMEIYKRSSPATGQGPYGVNKRFLTGFTKKDLIVVLACIVFLLANIAAIGPRGRRHAKDMLCLSNLHKWGIIFQQFAADNDGYFMRGWTPGNAPPNAHKGYWMEALRPYYGNNHKLRCCPEATIPGTDLGLGPWGGNGTFTAWGAFQGEVCGEPSPAWSWAIACDYGSYGMNGYVCNPPPGYHQGHTPWGLYNWRTANVAGADNIPVLTGAQWVDARPMQTDLVPEYDGEPWGPYGGYSHMVRVCLNRHSGFVNSAFLDFSARKVGLKELWKLKWHRSFDVNAPPPDWPEWMQDFQDY